MDSANNSGSMQSSDEEYESRGESFTSFLNPSGAGGHFGSISDHHHHHQPPPSPPLLPQQYHQNSLFNPNSQSLEAAFAQSSNVNTEYGGNHDVVWSRGLRSQNNHHPNFENFVALSSSSSPSSFSSSSNQSLFGASSHSQLLLNQQQQQQQPQFASSSSSTMPPSQSAEGNPPTAVSDHHQSIGKNPKKRTRASRRAPTTVLTTDTTNFRQMVQEFTGIPAAPFSSSPYSRRLDLFSGGGGGGGVSGMRSGNLDALNPLYPLRPSAQKHQISPFLPQSSSSSSSPSSLLSSTMLEALVSATNQSTTNNASSTTPENLLSMHNQMLSFQQQPTSLKNSTSILGTKSLTANANVTSSNKLRSTTQQGVPVTSFDDFGLNHENNVNENVGNINQQLGSNISGNYQFNCSASTSEFHSDKGLENVSSSGEGTVGQWVCPDH